MVNEIKTNMGVGRPDYILLLTIMALLVTGVIMVFSSSSYYALLTTESQDAYYYLKYQIAFAAGSFMLMLFVMRFSYTSWRKFAKLLLGISMVLLVAVLVAGEERLGAQRWLNLGFFSFQPSEFVKIFLYVVMAYQLENRRQYIQDFKQGVLPVLFLGGLATLLILLEDDLGTTMVLAGTTFILLIIAGARLRTMGLVALLGLAGGAVAIWFSDYRRARFLAFLDPQADPSGSGYQILNSLMSIGSGGFLGTGLGQGRHSKYLYLPERHTDFIFSVIGEELGFIGCVFVILLFLCLFWRGYRIALNAPDAFACYLAAGITTSIALQTFINIGVVTGSLPITGITLPFISYGGTSLVTTMLAMGILLNISR
ncbi:MAG: putative lipid II flippase FtsW, partial [Clostridia bacterium]|nr:putative lipid II flippase FtsW [Clostridia bacterium]